MIIFISKIYIEQFFTTQVAVYAPRIDLDVAEKLKECKIFNKTIFTNVETKFRNHLWNWNTHNICFALFDKNVSIETKNFMRSNILSKNPNEERILRATVETELSKVKLYDFCNQSSLEFFKILGISHSFLLKETATWENDESFCIARSTAYSVLSVNDIAERGVKVADDYNRVITKHPTENENICINAYETRKKYRK